MHLSVPSAVLIRDYYRFDNCHYLPIAEIIVPSAVGLGGAWLDTKGNFFLFLDQIYAIYLSTRFDYITPNTHLNDCRLKWKSSPPVKAFFLGERRSQNWKMHFKFSITDFLSFYCSSSIFSITWVRCLVWLNFHFVSFCLINKINIISTKKIVEKISKI